MSTRTLTTRGLAYSSQIRVSPSHLRSVRPEHATRRIGDAFPDDFDHRRGDLIDREPTRLAGFVTGCRGSAGLCTAEHENGEVVMRPVIHPHQRAGRHTNARFLDTFAHGRFPRRLAFLDEAPGHLPGAEISSSDQQDAVAIDHRGRGRHLTPRHVSVPGRARRARRPSRAGGRTRSGCSGTRVEGPRRRAARPPRVGAPGPPSMSSTR